MSQLPPGFVLDSAPQGGGSMTLEPLPAKPKDPPEPKTTYRTLTDAEATAQGLPPGKTYQVSSEGKVDALEGAGANPNDTKEVLRGANLDSIIGQVNRVQDLYNTGIRDETLGNAFGLLDSVGPEAGKFDAAGQAIADQGLAAFRVPGIGAQSDMEARQFALANTPQSGNWDAAIEEKLRTMRARVDANRKAMGLPPAQWTGIEPEAAAPPPVPGAGAADPVAPMDGGRQENDPSLAGVRGQYLARLQAKQDPREIVRWLRDQGVTNPGVLRTAMMQAAHRIKTNTPVDQYSTSQLDDRFVPSSGLDQALSDAAASAPGAYAISAGNFLSGNTLDNVAGALGGDEEAIRQNLELSRTESPTASAIGDVSGGVLASMGGEAALGGAGMAPGLVRGFLADLGMGAANGAGAADAPDDSRLGGAAKGAVAAGVGNAAGTVGSKLVGRLIAPTGGSMADLYKAGVRPTLGQRVANANDGRGFTGMAGKAVNATEEALQSVPVVGSAIRGARQEARDQFQIGGFNDALKEIGEELPKGMKPGNDPHKLAQAAFNRVYDQARSGMRMVADEEMANDLGQLAPDIDTLSDFGKNRVKLIIDRSLNRHLREGSSELDGAAYKAAVSDLGKHIARFRKSTNAEEQQMGDVLQGVQDAVNGAARRSSDPDAVALLDAADAGYAKLVRIEEASARRGGDSGTFSPAQLESSVQKTSGGVRSRAYLRGDALMQDYAKAGRGLEDKLSNSGTTDRAMVGMAATGGLGTATGVGAVSPVFLGVLGAIGAAYAPGVRRVVKGAMAPPGPLRKAIGQQLEKRARYLGKPSAAGAEAALQERERGQ